MNEAESKESTFFTCENETWFSILSRSRDTNINSKNGAWDSPTHWIERGLDKCLNSNMVKTCTQKSLIGDNHSPRESMFKLNREHTSDRDKYSKQGITDIDAMREDWINTILFDSYHDKIKFNGYNILTYEFPLGSQRGNELLVDLLSINKLDKKIGLIELKQANNKNNSPLLALVELICYGIQFIKSQEFILKEMKELDNEYFNRIGLFMVAPEKYWKYWQIDTIKNRIEDIVTAVNSALSNEAKPTFFLEFYKINKKCELIRS